MALFTRFHDGSYRASTAMVTGAVDLGVDSSLWFGAVVRGDVARVSIGARTNVQDNAVVHCDTDVPNVIGTDVVIGHGAIVHGAAVGDGTLIGMGSTLLGGSKIGRRCLVAAGAVVAPGLEVPDGMVVMGVPGKVVRPIAPKDLQYMDWLVAHYVELAARYARGEIGPTP